MKGVSIDPTDEQIFQFCSKLKQIECRKFHLFLIEGHPLLQFKREMIGPIDRCRDIAARRNSIGLTEEQISKLKQKEYQKNHK